MVQQAKARLRKEMMAKRDSMSEEDRSSRTVSIIKRLLSDQRFEESRVVAFYMAKGSEVETREMIMQAVEMKKEVLLPVVVSDDHIELFRFVSFFDLKPGRFGIMEPGNRIPPTRVPDLIILPGVSFGLCMHRLGYGKGYYDRLLAKLPSYRIGICFDFQVVESLPRHEDDQRMHKIITDKRVIE